MRLIEAYSNLPKGVQRAIPVLGLAGAGLGFSATGANAAESHPAPHDHTPAIVKVDHHAVQKGNDVYRGKIAIPAPHVETTRVVAGQQIRTNVETPSTKVSTEAKQATIVRTDTRAQSPKKESPKQTVHGEQRQQSRSEVKTPQQQMVTKAKQENIVHVDTKHVSPHQPKKEEHTIPHKQQPKNEECPPETKPVNKPFPKEKHVHPKKEEKPQPVVIKEKTINKTIIEVHQTIVHNTVVINPPAPEPAKPVPPKVKDIPKPVYVAPRVEVRPVQPIPVVYTPAPVEVPCPPPQTIVKEVKVPVPEGITPLESAQQNVLDTRLAPFGYRHTQLYPTLTDAQLREGVLKTEQNGYFSTNTIGAGRTMDQILEEGDRTRAEKLLIAELGNYDATFNKATEYDELKPEVQRFLRTINAMDTKTLLSLKQNITPEKFQDVLRIWLIDHRPEGLDEDLILKQNRAAVEAMARFASTRSLDSIPQIIKDELNKIDSMDDDTAKTKYMNENMGRIKLVFS